MICDRALGFLCVVTNDNYHGFFWIYSSNGGSILTAMLQNVVPNSLVDKYTVFEEISVLQIHVHCLNTETVGQCMPQWRGRMSCGTRTK
jgi:hypothetical protein